MGTAGWGGTHPRCRSLNGFPSLVMIIIFGLIRVQCSLPSIRQHLSSDDCLEDDRHDYRNCSGLHCAHILTNLGFEVPSVVWAKRVDKSESKFAEFIGFDL